MSYQKVSVNKFRGLNSTVAPELIDDGEARDILNFRMEKIGKLVSRNGYQYGLFTRPCFFEGAFPFAPPCDALTGDDFGAPSHGENMSEHEKRTMSYVYSAGCIGIGEMVLEERWDALDTDKLMVYVLRGMEISPDIIKDEELDSNTFINRAIYLFAPLTGKYQNHIVGGVSSDSSFSQWLENYKRTTPGHEDLEWYKAISSSIEVSDFFDIEAQGKDFDGNTRMRAPNRLMYEYDKIPCTNDLKHPDKKLDHWIDHYVDMERYRHTLVIADRINGDLLLENEFTRESLQQGRNRQHRLRLRANTLDLFNVDDVVIDPRFQPNEENDKSKGVKSGMALYKFVLPKKQARITDDNFQKVIADEDRIGEGSSEDALGYVEYLRSVVNGNKNTTLISLLWQYNPLRTPQGMWWKNKCLVKRDYDFLFSTFNAAKEIDDLFGEVELDYDEYIKEDGTKEKEVISDVYIWNDLELQYYPSHGKNSDYTDLTDEQFFLNALSRLFNKTIPGMPRVEELRKHKGLEKEVPLGIWRYRFVWDYGDGNYSAPSAELVVPDITWSATPDTQLLTAYERPQLSDIDQISQRSAMDAGQSASFPIATYPTTSRYFPNIFQQNNNFDTSVLTQFGQNMFRVKKALYEGAGCTYGLGKEDMSMDPTGILLVQRGSQDGNPIWGNATIDEMGEFGTLYTIKAGDIHSLAGTVWEGSFCTAGDWFNNPLPTAKQRADWDTQVPNMRLMHINYGSLELFGAGIVIGDDKIDNHLKWAESYPKDQRVFVNAAKLNIPIFPQDTKPFTWNSVFSKNGKYRLPLSRTTAILNTRYDKSLNRVTPVTPVSFAYRLVFDGINMNIGSHIYNLDSPRNQSSSLVNTPYEVILADYAGVDENLYFNVLTDVNERQNMPIFSGVDLDITRPETLLRATKVETDRLMNVIAKADPDAVNRLLVSGFGEFHLLRYGQSAYLDSTKAMMVKGIERNVSTGEWKGIYTQQGYLNDYVSNDDHPTNVGRRPNDLFYERTYNYTYQNVWRGNDYDGTEGEAPQSLMIYDNNAVQEIVPPISNLDIYMYLEGERLLIPEQLTAYFPSSLLFKSPRLAIKIPYNKVPARAKKLLIFRTIASHDNNWQPTNYGEVDTVEINRITQEQVIDGVINSAEQRMWIDTAYTEVETTKEWYAGIYYFDKKRDEELDFGHSIDEYDGFTRQLKSRFAKALNERLYYANFKETYAPHQLRGAISPILQYYKLPLSNTSTMIPPSRMGIRDWNARELKIESALTDLRGRYQYGIVSEDGSGVKSRLSQLYETSFLNQENVLLYWLPSGYDTTIETVKLYRRRFINVDKDGNEVWTPYYLIGEIEHKDEGIFVDNGKPNGKQLIDVEPETVNYESGVRWSEPYQPDKIKAASFAEYGSGNGSPITGIEYLAGNLAIFKENNIYRVAVQAAEPPISRTDALTNDLGCIAPNTLININDTVYFLSWKGFYRYNNNIPEPVDSMFKEELQRILDYCKNIGDDRIRDASCGYNPVYDEIYLNIPMLPTAHWYLEKPVFRDGYNGHVGTKSYKRDLRDTVTGDRPILPTPDITEVNPPQYEAGHSWDYPHPEDDSGHERELLGHIYIISPTKGYTSKFAYTATWMYYDSDREEPNRLSAEDIVNSLDLYHRKLDVPSQLIRLYYNDTEGNMRSADILPAKHASKRYVVSESTEDFIGEMTATYIEGNLYTLTPPTTSVIIDPDEITIKLKNNYMVDEDTNTFVEVIISQVMSNGTKQVIATIYGQDTEANCPYELSDEIISFDIPYYKTIRLYDLKNSGFISDTDNATIRIELDIWSVIEERGCIWQYYQERSVQADKVECLWKHWHAGIYIETPYDRKRRLHLQFNGMQYYLDSTADQEITHYMDYDEHLHGIFYSQEYFYKTPPTNPLTIQSPTNYLTGYNYKSYVFPVVNQYPIKSKYKSKFFTGDAETAIKRIRKGVLNMFSHGIIDVRGVTVNEFVDDDRMTDNGRRNAQWAYLPREASYETYQYPPTVDYSPANRLYGLSQTYLAPAGTTTNIISFVPRRDDDAMFSWDGYDDVGTKPIRYSVEISTEMRAQLNEINLYWRPINLHLS